MIHIIHGQKKTNSILSRLDRFYLKQYCLSFYESSRDIAYCSLFVKSCSFFSTFSRETKIQGSYSFQYYLFMDIDFQTIILNK